MLLRYIAASLVALSVDYAAFLALLHLATPPVPAAVLGYTAGIVIHWLISSRAVFGKAVAASGPARNRQKLLFAATALVGVALTGAVVALGSLTGVEPRLAKLAAVAISFIATWLLRRHLVFALVDPRPGARLVPAYPATE